MLAVYRVTIDPRLRLPVLGVGATSMLSKRDVEIEAPAEIHIFLAHEMCAAMALTSLC